MNVREMATAWTVAFDPRMPARTDRVEWSLRQAMREPEYHAPLTVKTTRGNAR